MKKAILVLAILTASLTSNAVEITTQDIEQVIAEQTETHSEVLAILVEVK